MSITSNLKVSSSDALKLIEKKKINVFTTRPDTIFGATFLAVSVDHPICKEFEKKFLKNNL